MPCRLSLLKAPFSFKLPRVTKRLENENESAFPAAKNPALLKQKHTHTPNTKNCTKPHPPLQCSYSGALK